MSRRMIERDAPDADPVALMERADADWNQGIELGDHLGEISEPAVGSDARGSRRPEWARAA